MSYKKYVISDLHLGYNKIDDRNPVNKKIILTIYIKNYEY